MVPTYGTTGRPCPPPSAGGDSPRRVIAARPFGMSSVFSLARVFAADTPIHTATNGAHSCYLAVAGELKYCCEDLGATTPSTRSSGRRCSQATICRVRWCSRADAYPPT